MNRQDRSRPVGARRVRRPASAVSHGVGLARSTWFRLRSMGEITRGPKAFAAGDRSRFLQALDEAVHRARRLKV